MGRAVLQLGNNDLRSGESVAPPAPASCHVPGPAGGVSWVHPVGDSLHLLVRGTGHHGVPASIFGSTVWAHRVAATWCRRRGCAGVRQLSVAALTRDRQPPPVRPPAFNLRPTIQIAGTPTSCQRPHGRRTRSAKPSVPPAPVCAPSGPAHTAKEAVARPGHEPGMGGYPDQCLRPLADDAYGASAHDRLAQWGRAGSRRWRTRVARTSRGRSHVLRNPTRPGISPPTSVTARL